MDTIYPPTETETEIFRIKNELSSIDLMGLLGKEPAALSELRSFIFLVHDDVEELLVSIIAQKLFFVAGKKAKSFPLFLKKIKVLFKNDTIAKLMNTASEIGAIPQELLEDISELRKLRIIFAHLHDRKFLIFEDEEQQLRVYQLLWRIVRYTKNLNYQFGS